MIASKEERAVALRFIVCLGVVSLFADMTYEGAYSIIGPFLKDLGASATQVGIIAGLGEMIAASLRYFSGKLVDRTRAYWGVAIFGYVLNLVVVPAMAFAGNWQMAALLVVMERTGKSLRGPARDVLLSEATGKVGHGWGFGVHAAMDQTGAVLGPLLMVAAVARTEHFGPAFLRLAIPAGAALAALLAARAVYPNAGATTPKPVKQQALPKVFWMYVAAAGVLACGFVDFPLLAYHFQKTAIARPAVIPLLYAGAMGVNGLTALIFGKLFDRYGIQVLTFGLLVSLFALPLGFLGGPAGSGRRGGLLGRGPGGPGRHSAFRHCPGGFHEQTRHRIRSLQRHLRRRLVSGQRHHGPALRPLPAGAGSLRHGGAGHCRRHVLSAAQQNLRTACPHRPPCCKRAESRESNCRAR